MKKEVRTKINGKTKQLTKASKATKVAKITKTETLTVRFSKEQLLQLKHRAKLFSVAPSHLMREILLSNLSQRVTPQQAMLYSKKYINA